MRLRYVGCLILGLLFCVDARAASTEEMPQRIDRIIKQLDDDDFRIRDAAAAEAAELPPDALPGVEAALKRNDLSIATRIALEKSTESLRNKSRQADRYTRRLAWYENAVGGYEQFGSKNEKWNDDARTALRLAARYLTSESRDRSLEPAMWEASHRAVVAGCDDPMVLYVHAKMFEKNVDVDVGETSRLYKQAFAAMEGSKYPALFRAIAAVRADRIDDAVKILPEAADDKDAPPNLIGTVAFFIVARPMGPETKMRFDQVEPILVKSRGANSAVVLALRGRFYTRYGRLLANGGDSTVPVGERDRVSNERMATARSFLEQAWKSDPTDPAAPTAMLDWAIDEQMDREEMERWYNRAMEADPDNFEAAQTKLIYLSPRQRGQTDDMIAFGRQFLATGNFQSRLPFILVNAHDILSHFQDELTAGAEADPAYFRRPEVWKDISAVYEGYLSRYPQSIHDRSYYAKLACWAEQWDVANEQFQILGDKAKLSLFGPTDTLHRAFPLEYQKMRAEAERRATRKPKSQ